MSPAERQALRDRLIALARRAGEAIMAIYASDFAVEHKDDRSPLTAADIASHRLILEGLAALTPDLPILSEESADIAYADRREWRTYWLVDPLDGTREFVKRNGEFTVNIALIEDGHPTIGVVYAPALDYLAHAVAGADAIETDRGVTRQLVVVSPDRARFRVAGSRSHGDTRTQRFLDKLGAHELIALGSSLKFCRVAGGAADVYLRFGPTSEWDTAAGQCVLEVAGGQVTTLEFAPLVYNRRESLLNPDFIAVADSSVNWRQYL